MDSDREQRMAANEGLARRINEAIESGQWPGEQGQRTAYRCECAQLDCKRTVELMPAEYEQVRAHPRRFLVLPGHERPQVETVIEATPAYLVVSKDGDAGGVAEATDPRD